MFDVKKENCNTITEKLLWDIWELLKKEVPLILNKESKIEETKIEVRQTIGHKSKIQNCKYCGKEHDNMGEFLACSRQLKKQKG